jgi:hypothetical protein
MEVTVVDMVLVVEVVTMEEVEQLTDIGFLVLAEVILFHYNRFSVYNETMYIHIFM